MKKVILNKSLIVLTTVFILTLILTNSISKSNKAIGYDYVKSSYWDGSGLTFSPLENNTYISKYVPFKSISIPGSSIDITKIYVIEDAIDLYQMSVLCMGNNGVTYLGLNYVLGNDINYDIASEHGYLVYPIGFETNKPFTGTFDGQGFEIQELYFEPISSQEEYEVQFKNDLRYYSLFSQVGTTGVVKNLGLINPTMIQPIDWGIMRFASPLVGLNKGLVDHVYVIDDRVDSGISVDGDFYLSGLMSMNEGTFTNAFVSTKCVKSIAVTTNLGVKTVIYENLGTMNKIYYDSNVYLDPIDLNEIATGLTTANFQSTIYFGEGWYLNKSYDASNTQSYLSNTYPILKGLKVDQSGNYEISSAANLWYLGKLLDSSIYYRSKTFILTKDIDMNALADDAYIAPNSTFSGSFTSKIISDPLNTTIYTRTAGQGATNYYSILGLTVINGAIIGTATTGTYVSYGLLGVVTGKIENINIIDAKIQPIDLEKHILKTRNVFGLAVGHLNGGSINNVHVHGNITLPSQTIGKTYVGGLAGYGNGTIQNSTTLGSISGGVHPYHTSANNSAVGGIMGYSVSTLISKVINQMNITGISFSATTTSILYLGGIVGYGATNGVSEVVNKGNIISNDTSGFVYQIHLGGIVGLHTQDGAEIYRINNKGFVNLLVKSPMIAKVAGYGNINSLTNFTSYSIANEGLVFTSYLNDNNNFTSTQLENIKIEMAGVAVVDGTNAYFQGVFNKANFTIDLSVCNNFATTILANNNYSVINNVNVYDNVSPNYGTATTIIQSYNYGSINAITRNSVTSFQIKISGNILGKNINYDEIRNTGSISVHFSRSSTKLLKSAPDADGVTMPYKNLKVMGVLEEVSNGKKAHNLYNGGKISVTMDSLLTVKFNLYISGIAYKNANIGLFSENNLDYTAVDIDPKVKGSMHNVINDGEIYAKGQFYGQSRISGIVSINASLISSVFNTGNIYNENQIRQVESTDTYSSNEFEVETAGITFLMSGPYAQIKDSANYGTISSYSSSAYGWVNASGIAVRNEKTENGTDYGRSSISGSHFGKIEFAINYGNIYSWNSVNETSYTINNESRCKASGVLTLGVLSTINVINYGNIYSRYVASGIYAFVFFQKFTIGVNEVYIANSINYGKIRRLLSTGSGTGVPFYYDSTTKNTVMVNNYYIDNNYVSKNENYSAFGALIGKIHTNSTDWVFISGDFSIRNVIFSYLINFDSVVDVIGQSPNANITSNNVSSTTTMELVDSINQFMATVKLNDLSKYPFNKIKSYTLDTAPITGNSGLPGTSTTYSGIFHTSFSLRTPPKNPYYITDNFIQDFIQFIPYSKVNTDLATRIGLNTIGITYGDNTGIYALSSATGITNGEFIPDNINFEKLSPYVFDASGEIINDMNWMDQIVSGVNTIRFKFTNGMKQLNKSIASTVFDMELICVENPAIVLKDPEIDLAAKMITYYVASNSDASISSNQTRTVNKYIEAGPNVPGSLFVPYTYNSTDGKWVGQFAFRNNQYVPIGPYNTIGNYNVYFYDYDPDPSKDNIRAWYFNDGVMGPVYNPTTGAWTQQKLYEYFARYASGTNISNLYALGTLVNPGYGPYEQFFEGNNKNKKNYRYVGPTTETKTYVRVQETVPVFINSYSFRPNIDSNYLLSKNASFRYTFNNQTFAYSGNKNATVPVVSGIYDVVYDGSNNLLDKMSDHFGLVRVYAEAYNHTQSTDPYTFTDYTIRIVRTPNESITDLTTVLVDGVNARPTLITNIRDVFISSKEVYFKPQGELGTLRFTYATNNIANNANLLDQFKLKFYTSGVEVNPNLYTITGGRVTTTGSFNGLTGSWGSGSVTFVITVKEEMINTIYAFDLTLSTSSNYRLSFYKKKSSDAFVTSIGFNSEQTAFTTPTSSFNSLVPYGIYYNAADLKTKIVNFTNLSSMVNISAVNLQTNFPAYLDSIRISTFAKLNKVVLNVAYNTADSPTYRYIYTLTYTIQAEDGTISTFTHRLYEQEVLQAIQKTYRDGNIIDSIPINTIIFDRESYPTYRIDYNLQNVYFNTNQEFGISLNFTGNTTLPVNNVDYFIMFYPNIGFVVEFSKNAPVGNYQFNISYSATKTLSTGQVMNWNRTFQSITIIKEKNRNSHLTYVTFVTDTVYSGLDTIIDINSMNEATYINYLLDRSSREIITLPNSGISYNDYQNYNAYWVVGQVQKTNLSIYSPSFYLPYGATIYRITDPLNAAYPAMQSTNLYADFNPLSDETEFNYVRYRVYAEDYNPNLAEFNTHYTDYYIAVQDITNNVRFTLQVKIDPSINPIVFDKLYITFNAYQDSQLKLSMSMFSYFYKTNLVGTNNQFSSTISGQYEILVDLPVSYKYEIRFKSIDLLDNQFVIQDSVIPRKYAIVITIKPSGLNAPWGQNQYGSFETYAN